MTVTCLEEINPKLYTINYLQCQNGFRTKERLSRMPYFLYVHKGEGVFIIGETEHKCMTGDLFFCPYGVPNTIIADDNGPYLLSGIDFEFSEDMPSLTPPAEFKEHINIHNNQQFYWLTIELIKCNAIKDKQYEAYTQSLFKAWLLLVRNLSKENYNSSIAEDIVVYLSVNCGRNVSLSEIAKEFKYHPHHINRLFKNRFSTTLKQYHFELRIKKAMELLTYSNYNISEISNICGYDNINYFSRIFKRKTSLTPSQYRNYGSVTLYSEI